MSAMKEHSGSIQRMVLKYLAGRFIPAVVVLAVIVLSVRFLGPEEYGRYSLLYCASLLAITLSFHWVQVSILRFLGSMPSETSVVMNRFFDLTLLSAIVATLLVVVAGIFYFDLSPVNLILVGLFTIMHTFYLFHQAILEAYHRSVRTAILEGTDQLLILISLLAGMFLFDFRTATLLFISLVAGLAGTLLLRFLIRVKGLLKVDLTHFYWDARFSGKVIGSGYSIALWLFFSHALMAIDRFVLMEYLGYRDAGMYAGLKDLIYKGVTFAGFPIYLSYQARITGLWNSRQRAGAWKAVKEALSFEILIFIIVFILFMVIKPWLFGELLRIPQMSSWMYSLPVLLAAFIWQAALLVQRFLELNYRSAYMLIAIGISMILNVVLNLIFVPLYGMVASSMTMLATSLCYAGFVIILAWRAERHLVD
jgi:O-antigen/teichoic acid export membrane protein